MTAYIRDIDYYLPSNILSNEDLNEQFPDWSVERISKKIGINERRVVAEGENSSDLAYNAAIALFEHNAIDIKNIDYLILCTQSPDFFLPTTACILQDRLGLATTCGALDFNLGCSGYVYGLGLAKGLIISEQAKNVLLITAETYSKYLHSDDKGNRSIFGDAAAATLVSGNKRGEINGLIHDFVYGTDGSGAEKLIVRNGASRNPGLTGVKSVDEFDNTISEDHLYMEGRAVFNFTIDVVPKLINSTLLKNNVNLEDIDLFIFHQANSFMLNHLRKKIGIDESKFYVDMEDVGNTVSSTIPIALKRALDKKIISKGDKVLFAGFGVGLSWGAVIIDF